MTSEYVKLEYVRELRYQGDHYFTFYRDLHQGDTAEVCLHEADAEEATNP